MWESCDFVSGQDLVSSSEKVLWFSPEHLLRNENSFSYSQHNIFWSKVCTIESILHEVVYMKLCVCVLHEVVYMKLCVCVWHEVVYMKLCVCVWHEVVYMKLCVCVWHEVVYDSIISCGTIAIGALRLCLLLRFWSSKALVLFKRCCEENEKRCSDSLRRCSSKNHKTFSEDEKRCCDFQKMLWWELWWVLWWWWWLLLLLSKVV